MLPDLPPVLPDEPPVVVVEQGFRRNHLMPGKNSAPTLQCFMREAERHSIDPYVLLAVLATEGGRPGELAFNRNGTIDLGPMSVNTVWLPVLAKHYRTNEEDLQRRLASDGCANVAAGALILGRKIAETGDVWEGVARYHSRNPKQQGRYLARVHASLSRIVARLRGKLASLPV